MAGQVEQLLDLDRVPVEELNLSHLSKRDLNTVAKKTKVKSKPKGIDRRILTEKIINKVEEAKKLYDDLQKEYQLGNHFSLAEKATSLQPIMEDLFILGKQKKNLEGMQEVISSYEAINKEIKENSLGKPSEKLRGEIKNIVGLVIVDSYDLDEIANRIDQIPDELPDDLTQDSQFVSTTYKSYLDIKSEIEAIKSAKDLSQELLKKHDEKELASIIKTIDEKVKLPYLYVNPKTKEVKEQIGDLLDEVEQRFTLKERLDQIKLDIKIGKASFDENFAEIQTFSKQINSIKESVPFLEEFRAIESEAKEAQAIKELMDSIVENILDENPQEGIQDHLLETLQKKFNQNFSYFASTVEELHAEEILTMETLKETVFKKELVKNEDLGEYLADPENENLGEYSADPENENLGEYSADPENENLGEYLADPENENLGEYLADPENEPGYDKSLMTGYDDYENEWGNGETIDLEPFSEEETFSLAEDRKLLNMVESLSNQMSRLEKTINRSEIAVQSFQKIESQRYQDALKTNESLGQVLEGQKRIDSSVKEVSQQIDSKHEEIKQNLAEHFVRFKDNILDSIRKHVVRVLDAIRECISKETKKTPHQPEPVSSSPGRTPHRPKRIEENMHRKIMEKIFRAIKKLPARYEGKFFSLVKNSSHVLFTNKKGRFLQVKNEPSAKRDPLTKHLAYVSSNMDLAELSQLNNSLDLFIERRVEKEQKKELEINKKIQLELT